MRLLRFQDGNWTSKEDPEPEVARELAMSPVPVWVRAEGTNDEDWDQLDDWFDLHPLALEDIANPRQRPKVEDYPGITFAVMRLPRLVDGELAWSQVGLFLGAGFVLTATTHSQQSLGGVPELDDIERRLLAGGWKEDEAQVDRVFYRIVDALVDAYFPFMDGLEDELEVLEDSVLDHAGTEELSRIRDMKQLLSSFRKTVVPMREAALSLERVKHPNITDATRLYLRDVSDHMVRIHERLEHVKEVALIAQETWNSALANQQNQVMKVLTIMATIFIPLTFVAGIYGMNFENMPELGWRYGYLVVWLVMITITVGMLWAFHRRDWL